ncbi:hypothetical protein ACM66B_003975 [Microbotryomycetes sp. NB124-2]
MHTAFELHELVGPSELGQEVITASSVHAGKLALGTDKGSLLVFELSNVSTSTALPTARFISKHDSFAKKAVDQLAVVTELDALVCLSGGDLTLHELGTYAQISSLSTHTKGAASLFSVATRSKGPGDNATSATSTRTTIAVAAKRRLVLLNWVDGAWKSPTELALPHQIRGMAFNESGDKLLAGFSTGEYGVVTLSTPPSANQRGSTAPVLGDLFAVNMTDVLSGPGTEKMKHGSGGLGSLGSGWSALGLASRKLDKNDVLALSRSDNGKGKHRQNQIEAVDDWLWKREWGWEDLDEGAHQNEFLVVRENVVVPVSLEGKILSKPGDKASIVYGSITEDTTVVPPFVVSLVESELASSSGYKLVVHSSVSLKLVQSLSLPSTSSARKGASTATTARILSSSLEKNLAFVLGTSTHGGSSSGSQSKARDAVAAVSQTLHVLKMRSWTEQIDELGPQGQWDQAIELVRASQTDPTTELTVDMLSKLSRLHALSLFRERKDSLAIDAFIALDTTPARVVALYPETISGKLHVQEEMHESLFGGRTREQLEASLKQENPKIARHQQKQPDKTRKTHIVVDDDDRASIRSASSQVKSGSRESSRTASAPNTATRSNVSASGSPTTTAFAQQSPAEDMEELIRFLTDRRQKYARAFAALPPLSRPKPSTTTNLVAATPDELLSIPDVPLDELDSNQLVRVAQVVDTALFRSYLATKPVMVGPLCRIENWCQVDEVEQLLLDVKKYQELLDLYNGKGMHSKALNLLRRMSQDEEDEEEKVGPTVRYLQKLGRDHLDVILESSRWVLELNRDAGMQIFVADLEEVESLPRHAVMDHLASIGSDVCQLYLENVIHSLDEQGAEFHEKLIELYLDDVQSQDLTTAYDKLVNLLETSTSYRADRVLGRLPADMPRIKALLLGRLGRHEGALQIYVYQLQDPVMAEEYCKRVTANDPSLGPQVFLTLLRIYLRPKQGHALQLEHALSLLSSHASSIEPNLVFDMLPPLVGVRDLETFLVRTLRHSGQQKRDVRMLQSVEKSRLEQSKVELVQLESRRVKITETRVCPVCHKRLGNSVIAIHNPRGEVTHYQCREKFIELHAKG